MIYYLLHHKNSICNMIIIHIKIFVILLRNYCISKRFRVVLKFKKIIQQEERLNLYFPTLKILCISYVSFMKEI